VSRRTHPFSGFPPRLFGYAVGVIAIALPIAAGAVTSVLRDLPDAGTLAGVGVFFGCALLSEIKPVPLNLEGTRVVSLAFLFVITAQTLFGWPYGVLIGAGGMLAAQALTRTSGLKFWFNGAVYAISAYAASLPSTYLFHGATAHGRMSHGAVVVTVLLQGAIFVTANVLLVCLAISLAEGESPHAVVLDHFRHSGPAFVVMGVLAALAVTLWTVDPPLLALLAGPLLTLGLYQRYALSARVAEHAAATDSLTELKNHRSYKHSIRDAVARATPEAPIALCLLDVDDFKQINDKHGHPVGDGVLVEIARLLEDAAGGHEAFRLGGDEFALVVTGGAEDAEVVIEILRGKVRGGDFPGTVRPTISAGIAECPGNGETVAELERVADLALYWTKRHGKDRSCIYSPSVVELSLSQEIFRTAELDARLRAAENLINVVDARDTYTGHHSQRVAELAEAIGRELALDDETIAKLRLAALLHDLGKIAVPDQILQKPGKLTFRELMIIRRHPVAGSDLLEGLEVAPVDTWILHHHEHWDGSGYPNGLCGEEIPIGSRVILAADAYDAMTSDRAYRRAGDPETALAELHAASGKQFDPLVVDALTRVIAAELEEASCPMRAAAAV